MKSTEHILSQFSNKELRDELARRAKLRKGQRVDAYRCKDCIHCIDGYTSKAEMLRHSTTTVCLRKPKPKAGVGCYYAANYRQKACSDFKLREEL